jgi:hypothetical protein
MAWVAGPAGNSPSLRSFSGIILLAWRELTSCMRCSTQADRRRAELRANKRRWRKLGGYGGSGHPEITRTAVDVGLDVLKIGKAEADKRVERSLYERANGYTYDAVKIFMPAGVKKPVYAPYREHVPPDVTAGIFWLKNRDPAHWRDGVVNGINWFAVCAASVMSPPNQRRRS